MVLSVLVQDMQIETSNVIQLLKHRARDHGSKVFIREFGGRHRTYAESLANARRIASGLRRFGVTSADHVVVMMHDRLEAIDLWLGINFLGATEVAINTGYVASSFEHALNQCKASLIIMEDEWVSVLEESIRKLPFLQMVVILGDEAKAQKCSGVSVRPFRDLIIDDTEEHFEEPHFFDIASIIYTSGTTGPSKGVMMPHAQVMLIAKMTAEALRMRESDVFYSFTPLYHMAAKFMGVLGTMYASATLVLDQTFSAASWLDRVRDCGATVTGGPGTLIQMIYNTDPSPNDRDHLVTRIYGAPVPKHIASPFQERFGIKAIELWGMTEVGVPCWSPYDEQLRQGSCGRVDTRWYEIEVVDPHTDLPLEATKTGEIVVRPKAPWICSVGYIGMPTKTIEAWRNLWFHTGDLGYMDGEGYMYFVARSSERIRRRSENISAYEIEFAAHTYPSVVESAAVGVESQFIDDDDIKLCVVVRNPGEFSPDHLLEHLAKLLPHYMVPRYIEVLRELPRTATNKLIKESMKKISPDNILFWDRRTSGVSLRRVISSVRARNRGN